VRVLRSNSMPPPSSGYAAMATLGGFQKAYQVLAHDVRLLLMRPMTGAIHQPDAPEFGKASLPGSHGPARDPIGAPILFSRDELRGNIDGTPREGQLLGEGRGKELLRRCRYSCRAG
jgi:hypothetical protein